MFRAVLVVGSACLLVACGDDEPLSYSAPVGINLKAKSGDVKSGVINDEKEITTESGNPYGAFVKDARIRLGGRDPARIEIASLTLLLGGQTKGVADLQEVFSGKVEVFFLMKDTNNSVPVGDVTDPVGSGPVSLGITFNSAGLSPADWSKLVAGNFKVVIRGNTAAGFDKAGADADLQLTFVFQAFP